MSKQFRGFFNRYHKKMPLFERLLKDIGHLIGVVKNRLKHGGKHQIILAHPHYPSRGSTIFKVAKSLGYTITNHPSAKAQFAIYWEYNTERVEFELLERWQQKYQKTVLNLNNRNIGKKYIDAAHLVVFGYNTQVNPTTHKGKMVQKSDTNALHDGQVITGPIKQPKSDLIYQILIDNEAENNTVLDYRVPIVKGTIGFAYKKYRSITERFLNTTIKTEMVATESILSPEEINQINQFCQHLQLDYGELDILRDNTSKKIYVVDVNNTPQGPPANTPNEDGIKAIEIIGKELIRTL